MSALLQIGQTAAAIVLGMAAFIVLELAIDVWRGRRK